jgi:hypothetical protein
MNRYLIAILAIIALPAAANAAPCKDAKGKFIKCPPTASATHSPAIAASHRAVVHAAAAAAAAPAR